MEAILRWLYLEKEGPRLLEEVVNTSHELISRRKAGESSYEPGRQPLSTGAEILLKRYLPSLEEKLAKAEEQ